MLPDATANVRELFGLDHAPEQPTATGHVLPLPMTSSLTNRHGLLKHMTLSWELSPPARSEMTAKLAPCMYSPEKRRSSSSQTASRAEIPRAGR